MQELVCYECNTLSEINKIPELSENEFYVFDYSITYNGVHEIFSVYFNNRTLLIEALLDFKTNIQEDINDDYGVYVQNYSSFI